MVIAHGEKNGRRLLLLGLSQRNLTKLQADQPIYLTPETHPGCPHEMEIVIMFGPTENDIAARLTAIAHVEKIIAVPSSPKRPQ